jgi:hypothetical protein
MAAGPTYEPIATTTLGSAAASITFSSIPATYTDLRLVWTVRASSTSVFPYVTFNNDSGTNYSWPRLYGDGTSALSQRNNDRAYIGVLWMTAISNATDQFNLLTMDVFSYAGSTFKTTLTTASGDKNGSGTVEMAAALWRSTSAINRLDLTASSSTWAAGTTATLYGIKNA